MITNVGTTWSGGWMAKALGRDWKGEGSNLFCTHCEHDNLSHVWQSFNNQLEKKKRKGIIGITSWT